MKKKRLTILGLSYTQTQSGAYALVLSEESGHRRIPIIIGGAEAQAIAIQLEGLKPLRPLTHDLFVDMAAAFYIKAVEVNIYKLEEGIFYAEIICDRQGERVRIDARTSDAIALALRFRCPIYTTEDILSKSGIVFDPDDQKSTENTPPSSRPPHSLDEYTVDDLQELLSEAIEEENYEQASVLRDEIKRRTA